MNCKELEIEVQPQKPFEYDLFGLHSFGEMLTGIIDSYADTGAVITINGEWGIGKTTFLRMWNQYLIDSHYRTLFFNAWQCDYYDDPMLALIGELSEEFGQKSGFQDFVKKGGRLAFRFGGELLKGIIKNRLGADLDAVVDEVTDIGIESVKDYRESKNLLEDFKKQLTEIVADPENEKPVVFIIDELDRCNPKFAVKLLERLKHLFEVPNIIFVLGLNIEQLQYAVQGFYGSAYINGNEYLKRFFDVELSLPSPKLDVYCKSLFASQGIDEYFKKHEDAGWMSERDREATRFSECACDLIIANNTNLRKTYRIVHYMRLVFAGCMHNAPANSDLLFLLCFLKIHFPLSYNKIMHHEFCIQELLDEMERILPNSLLLQVQKYGAPRRMAWLIAKLLLHYNHLDGHGSILDKNFTGSLIEANNKYTYPVKLQIITAETLYEALRWHENNSHAPYEIGIDYLIEKIQLAGTINIPVMG